ncbi:hypothetical protein SAMN05660330_02762 [Desulforhopalus singaporensis]|uniref:Uncharacterized protein n=1 Tax=Desulforhopalus singaporensis TaxID=91360 RepID=A0A1H0SPN7_9BACT|nr:hypothetical protein SAMN05660330_02762 [Desulforhopalus singaporensis]
MTCGTKCTQFALTRELLIEHGFEGLADCIAIPHELCDVN